MYFSEVKENYDFLNICTGKCVKIYIIATYDNRVVIINIDAQYSNND